MVNPFRKLFSVSEMTKANTNLTDRVRKILNWLSVISAGESRVNNTQVSTHCSLVKSIEILNFYTLL
jgi:hypothetical protein